MKLLILSSIRYIRKHWIQTMLTFLMTTLMVAILSAVFNSAAGFMDVLRRYAIEEVGTYHYKYKSNDIDAFLNIAQKFKDDSWFLEVSITVVDDEAVMLLTVSKPGLFTTKKMEEKFEEQRKMNQLNNITHLHNWELLVSYGDLWPKNGIYSFLIIFLFLMLVILATFFLSLYAVLKISINQREREIALFSSVGADNRQICTMLFLENLLYNIAAIPFGIVLGIYLLNISNNYLDKIFAGIGNFPPIRIVISVPYIIVVVFLILFFLIGAVYIPVQSISKTNLIEVLRNNQNISISNKKRKIRKKRFNQNISISDKKRKIRKKRFFIISQLISKVLKAEGFLAKKNYNRFKNRYKPVFLAISVSVALCLALSSIGSYSNKIIELNYYQMDYNMNVTLSGHDIKILDSFVENILQMSDHQLVPIRRMMFDIKKPYPLSEVGIQSGLFQGSGRMPDAMLISVDSQTFHSVCDSIGYDIDELTAYKGIFINTNRTWRSRGKTEMGKLYYLEPGDVQVIYPYNESEQPIEITINAVIEYWPPFTSIDIPTCLVILVSEETFLLLEAGSSSYEQDIDTYSILLKGMVSDTGKLDDKLQQMINQQFDISVSIENFDKKIEKDQAVISSIRYLLYGLIIILVLICLFCNFIVTWNMARTRRKEFAILLSVGMIPKSIIKMKIFESVQNGLKALFLGGMSGLCTSVIIHRVFLIEYKIAWIFPWSGLLAGILILCIVILLTEVLTVKVIKNISIAEILHED